ncbi:MAG: hypothetical protein UZ09_BCD002001014 [Bacteroidetes bacterium OLB9]|nr:MAG: hypothetical protein UZ09_BCD002001014 [Bacteroidetes bacterium OLB9]
MNLSEIGIIAQSEWEKSFELRPDMNLIRDEFIVMPNHFHAIIHIGKNKYNTPNFLEDSNNRSTGAMHCASSASSPSSASNASSASSASTNPKKSKSSTKNQFGPQSKNLASIIRGFKIGVTVNARKITPGFAWQPNYHDHVIRDNNEYQRIKIYIINNPANWKEDKFQKS